MVSWKTNRSACAALLFTTIVATCDFGSLEATWSAEDEGAPRVLRRRPLAYSPLDPERLASALTWNDPRVPIMRPPGPAASGYEAYTPGVTYGTVRRMTRAALETAVARGGLGRPDIVVVTDDAPTELGQVVAGIVTAAPQGALSHLAVRAERLDTLRDAIEDAPVPGRPDEDLVVALAARIDDVFGPRVMVRFRSSSNAEDGLRFNGAGLSDSTSVCAADSLDGGVTGVRRIQASSTLVVETKGMHRPTRRPR